MGSGAARVGGADPGARGGRTRGTLKRRTGCPGSAPRCAARPIPPHPRRLPPSALDFNPFKTKNFSDVRLRFSCGNIFGKQIGNVFVFTICFDVGLAVIVLKMTTNLEITYEPI